MHEGTEKAQRGMAKFRLFRRKRQSIDMPTHYNSPCVVRPVTARYPRKPYRRKSPMLRDPLYFIGALIDAVTWLTGLIFRRKR